MVRNSKHAFWQALVLAIIIFSLGLLAGYFIDVARAEESQEALIKSDINVLDDQLRSRIITDLDVSCELAIPSLFSFADKVYDEAVRLEEYESASKLGNTLELLHRRYDLLRTLIWLEAIELKEKCGDSFNTIVYMYNYEEQDVAAKAQQLFYSRLLFDLKLAHPEDIILLPIAVDTDLVAVDLLVKSYGVESFPIIIINEDIKIDGIVTLDELENIVFDAHN